MGRGLLASPAALPACGAGRRTGGVGKEAEACQDAWHGAWGHAQPVPDQRPPAAVGQQLALLVGAGGAVRVEVLARGGRVKEANHQLACTVSQRLGQLACSLVEIDAMRLRSPALCLRLCLLVQLVGGHVVGMQATAPFAAAVAPILDQHLLQVYTGGTMLQVCCGVILCAACGGHAALGKSPWVTQVTGHDAPKLPAQYLESRHAHQGIHQRLLHLPALPGGHSQ
mmetsp:Transcript_8676/g.21689  ORF Transcript_8676/g.21689 Transcript_8676/m.21689 type:complete len:226 (-) Transcript_8676:1177-1854(-)